MTAFTKQHPIQRDFLTSEHQVTLIFPAGVRVRNGSEPAQKEKETPGVLQGGTESGTRVAPASESTDTLGDQRPMECGDWERPGKT